MEKILDLRESARARGKVRHQILLLTRDLELDLRVRYEFIASSICELIKEASDDNFLKDIEQYNYFYKNGIETYFNKSRGKVVANVTNSSHFGKTCGSCRRQQERLKLLGILIEQLDPSQHPEIRSHILDLWNAIDEDGFKYHSKYSVYTEGSTNG